jgi:hypothetical protein
MMGDNQPFLAQEMNPVRRALVAAITISPLVISRSTLAMGVEPSSTGRITDFDFLRGTWKVRHRALIDQHWQEFEGQVESRALLAGQSNVDDNVWTWKGKLYRGLAVRVFDPERSHWSIFWLDGRSPEKFGPPTVGGFQGNIGTFLGEDSLAGKPIRVRLRWFTEDPGRPRWEQSYSFDQGSTWEPNWIWNFQR